MGCMSLAAAIFGLSLVLARAEYEIFHQRYSADPAPLAHAGRVWMYTTHDNLEPGYMVACADQDVDVKLIAVTEKDRLPLCAKWTLLGTTDASYGFRSWSTMRWLTASPSGKLSTTASDYIHPKANRYVLDSEARFDVEELAHEMPSSASSASAPAVSPAALRSWPSLASTAVRAFGWALAGGVRGDTADRKK